MVGAGRAWRGPGDDDWGRPLEWRHAASPALHLGCLRPLGAGAVAVRGSGIGVCAAGACLGLGAPVLGRWRIGLGAIAGRSGQCPCRKPRHRLPAVPAPAGAAARPVQCGPGTADGRCAATGAPGLRPQRGHAGLAAGPRPAPVTPHFNPCLFRLAFVFARHTDRAATY